MGEKLVKCFEFALEKGGVALKVKLAMKSAITTVTAPTLPDSPENLDRVRKALAELLPGEKCPF